MSVRARGLRRTRPTLAARVRTLWVVAALAVVAIIALIVAAVEAPQFRVRSIEALVTPGGPVTVADILTAAGIEPLANLWLLDTGAIRRHIESIPYVDRADVQRRQFPQPGITFEVKLRRPSGCVRLHDATVTIDTSSRVLQRGCATPDLSLVEEGAELAPRPGQRLSTPDAERLLADARAVGERVPVRIVRRDRFGGLEAIDRDGVLLRFGNDDDLATKLALVEPIRRSIASAKRLRAIDLRAPDTPVVEFP